MWAFLMAPTRERGHYLQHVAGDLHRAEALVLDQAIAHVQRRVAGTHSFED